MPIYAKSDKYKMKRRGDAQPVDFCQVYIAFNTHSLNYRGVLLDIWALFVYFFLFVYTVIGYLKGFMSCKNIYLHHSLKERYFWNVKAFKNMLQLEFILFKHFIYEDKKLTI